jgi:hypothetical protein
MTRGEKVEMTRGEKVEMTRGEEEEDESQCHRR